jgi:hypothetical protein
MRNRKSTKTDKSPEGRQITWGDLIEAAEETIRRNSLKNTQLKALVAHMRTKQTAGDDLPVVTPTNS